MGHGAVSSRCTEAVHPGIRFSKHSSFKGGLSSAPDAFSSHSWVPEGHYLTVRLGSAGEKENLRGLGFRTVITGPSVVWVTRWLLGSQEPQHTCLHCLGWQSIGLVWFSI